MVVYKFLTIFLFLISLFIVSYANGVNNLIWAINCGGESHIDLNGIKYQGDANPVGISSDYGKSMMINRVPQEDQIIYQTERYHTSNFGYDVPIPSDGDYVLVLKFSEVWFTAPNQKVFDVVLNSEHTVIERLDIFHKVGRGTAHDEVIPFRVKDGKLYVKGESSDLYYNKIQVDFIKGDRDNPKVNAILLFKGQPDDVPKLPSLAAPHSNDGNPGFNDGSSSNQNYAGDDEEDIFDHQTSNQQQQNQRNQQFQRDKARRKKLTSGPKSPDPYSTDDPSSMLFPLAVAIGAFLPILFCLCKL